MMEQQRIKEIAELAHKASRGYWFVDGPVVANEDQVIAILNSGSKFTDSLNARYIATMNPDTTVKLLEHIHDLAESKAQSDLSLRLCCLWIKCLIIALVVNIGLAFFFNYANADTIAGYAGKLGRTDSVLIVELQDDLPDGVACPKGIHGYNAIVKLSVISMFPKGFPYGKACWFLKNDDIILIGERNKTEQNKKSNRHFEFSVSQSEFQPIEGKFTSFDLPPRDLLELMFDHSKHCGDGTSKNAYSIEACKNLAKVKKQVADLGWYWGPASAPENKKDWIRR